MAAPRRALSRFDERIRVRFVDARGARYRRVRAAALGGDDLCDAAGQQIDFHQTKVERLAAGDPRLSIEERYPTHWWYVKEVTHAARRLGRERFLLDEDVQAYIEQAKASGIGK